MEARRQSVSRRARKLGADVRSGETRPISSTSFDGDAPAPAVVLSRAGPPGSFKYEVRKKRREDGGERREHRPGERRWKECRRLPKTPLPEGDPMCPETSASSTLFPYRDSVAPRCAVGANLRRKEGKGKGGNTSPFGSDVKEGKVPSLIFSLRAPPRRRYSSGTAAKQNECLKER
ncbi:hypothetical protein MRX96_038614 [Rhipicephalus microplus]